MDQSDIVRYVSAGIMAVALLGSVAVILVAVFKDRGRGE